MIANRSDCKIIVTVILLFSFRGTAIKPDMCNDFVSLLRICPLIKSLKYVEIIKFSCFAF